MTVLGFNGDSLTSICASEGSRSLMGGSTVVMWSLRVDLPADGKVLRCAVLVWDCCTLHSHCTLWWKMGASLYNCCLMGPPPQCSGFIFSELVCICNISFGVTHCLCLSVLGVPRFPSTRDAPSPAVPIPADRDDPVNPQRHPISRPAPSDPLMWRKYLQGRIDRQERSQFPETVVKGTPSTSPATGAGLHCP